MRVGFFASAFVGRRASGTADYVRNLVAGLKNHKKQVDLVIFCNHLSQVDLLAKELSLDGIEIQLLPKVKGKFLSSSRQYYSYSWNKRKQYVVDILHFSHPRLYPFFWKFPARKFVCTFHAAGDITAQNAQFVFSRKIYNMIAKAYWYKLDEIIAVSGTGKSEITQFYGIPSESITVIFPGTDRLWSLECQKPNVVSSSRFALVLGRHQPHKNMRYAIDEARKFNLANEVPLHFKFLARGLANLVTKEEEKSLFESKIEILDYVCDEEMKWLMTRSEFVVFPSLNEGFGIPIFEAFGEGKRVLVHKESPAVEALRNDKQIVPVNMETEGELSKTMLSLIQSPSDVSIIESRKKIRQLKMTWDKSVNEHKKIYSTLTSTSKAR